VRVFTSDDRVTHRAGYLHRSSASGLIYDALRFVQTEADTMRAEALDTKAD
jgi:hypothetical protein